MKGVSQALCPVKQHEIVEQGVRNVLRDAGTREADHGLPEAIPSSKLFEQCLAFLNVDSSPII